MLKLHIVIEGIDENGDTCKQEFYRTDVNAVSGVDIVVGALAANVRANIDEVDQAGQLRRAVMGSTNAA